LARPYLFGGKKKEDVHALHDHIVVAILSLSRYLVIKIFLVFFCSLLKKGNAKKEPLPGLHKNFFMNNKDNFLEKTSDLIGFIEEQLENK